MKLVLKIALVLVLLMSFQAVSFAASASPTPPLTPPAVAYANKVITHTYYLKEKVFAVLDDSSLWQIDPSYEQINGEHHDYLVGKTVTLMPDISNTDYKILFIIDQKIEHFNVKLASIPVEASQILDINPDELSLQYSLGEDMNKIMIMPSDFETVLKWQQGQKVVVGGVWFDEYDQAGLPECEYIYSLFNYDKQEFVRFNTFK